MKKKREIPYWETAEAANNTRPNFTVKVKEMLEVWSM